MTNETSKPEFIEQAIQLLSASASDSTLPLARVFRALALKEDYDDLRYALEIPDLGMCALVGKNDKFQTFFFYAKDKDGYSAAPLNFRGLTANCSRNEVLGHLASSRVNQGYSEVTKRAGPWDLFFVQGARLHFQYADDEASIDLVTVME